MVWTNWTAAAGVGIEFMGFGILAYELVETNRSAVGEAKDLAAEKELFETFTLSDGIDETGRSQTFVEGGVLGAMVNNLRRREKQLARSTNVIAWGVGVTALGAILQIVAAVAQALESKA
jgi:hypothetical protein